MPELHSSTSVGAVGGLRRGTLEQGLLEVRGKGLGWRTEECLRIRHSWIWVSETPSTRTLESGKGTLD